MKDREMSRTKTLKRCHKTFTEHCGRLFRHKETRESREGMTPQPSTNFLSFVVSNLV